MHTNTTPPTRRAILGAIGLAAPAAALGIPAATAKPAGVSPELRKLLDQERNADAACIDYTFNVHEPKCEQWQAAVDAIPHYEFTARTKSAGKFPVYSTRRREIVEMCASIVESGGHPDRPFTQDARRLTAAVKWREREIKRLKKRFGIAEGVAESNRLSDLTGEAMDAVVMFPAATIADLHAKMQRIMMLDYMACDSTAVFIAADIARLAGEA